MKGFKNQYPIVLAHGIARPDYLIDSLFRTLNLSIYDFSLVSDRFHYFKGIASYLKKHGFLVFHSSVSFAADVETRAKDLKQEILKILEKTGRDKVHIIAHSMGGLDARHMIVNEDMASRVATLTTIGTPHFGTTVAEVALEQGMNAIIDKFKVFLNLEGIRSVTPEECQKFNEYAHALEAKNEVFYQTYASSKSREEVFLPFQLTWKLIYDREGDNDGLVSLHSQKWVKRLVSNNGAVKEVKQHEFPMPADHLDQVGWWNLNEIHKAGWWNMRALREKNKHEEEIKNIYLQIAKDVIKFEKKNKKRRTRRSVTKV
ncbi:MAG: alpha/beta hydrolase [Calditrichaeota bacterium]|nr:MAG: alpha/beta hydrolase [Calditrichota bacterium]